MVPRATLRVVVITLHFRMVSIPTFRKRGWYNLVQRYPLSELIPETDTVPAPPEPAPSVSPWKHFFRDTLETVLLAIVLFLVINLISARVRVEGYSMLPTLDDGQFVLISRLTYKLGEPRRGDIIVFRPPMYPEESILRRLLGIPNIGDNYEDYIKRVIGVPGDTVKVENGTVFINNIALLEPYIAAAPLYSGEWTVPEGSLFVLGDNRNNSSDSHAWGLLPQDNILGKALAIYWPFTDWMVLKPGQTALAMP